MNMSEEEEHQQILLPREAALYLRIAESTLRRWVKSGRLKSVRLGRCVRIARSDLDRFIEANRS